MINVYAAAPLAMVGIAVVAFVAMIGEKVTSALQPLQAVLG